MVSYSEYWRLRRELHKTGGRLAPAFRARFGINVPDGDDVTDARLIARRYLGRRY